MFPNRPHVYVIPFPVQSHINPMLEFSKSLASRNINVTFFITTLTKKSTPKIPPNTSITFETIFEVSEESQEPNGTPDFFRRLEEAISRKVPETIINQQKDTHSTPKLIVYGSVFPWLLDIAHQHGLLGASFFTQSCSVSSIYYHIKQGLLRYPFDEDQSQVELPFLPDFGIRDLPALDKVMDSNQTMLKILVGQFSNLEKADFVLFNSFDRLESEVVQWMSTHWDVKTIGPTHLLQQNDVDTPQKDSHTINLFEPNQEECTKWLDSKETNSVVYVSFGSLVTLEKSQIEELALGLMMSKCNFLWVVRASEEHKLPPNFVSLASGRGLIVNWCTQTRVLAHRAVLCFLTHGGWNSTLEGLTYGVPFIVMAIFVDQTSNAKFIEDVWRVGVRVRVGENGMASREEICKCVGEVAIGEKGNELKRNASNMKRLAEEAMGEEGTTTRNIQDIVSRILCT